MSSGRWGGWSGKKDGKGNKSAAYGWLGNRGIVGQNWGGKCSIKKREGERSMALKGGGQEPFIPRFGCIPACLALILTASCYFFFFCFYLQTDWTPELPSPCLIQTSVTTWCLQLAEKKAEECYTPVISASLLPSDRKQAHELAGILNDLFPFRISPAWEPAARMGCTFLSFSTRVAVEISEWKSDTVFCPSGSGERLETFLAGQ